MDGVIREKGQCINIRKAHGKKCRLLVLQEQEDERSCEAEKGLPGVVKKKATFQIGFKGYAYVN